MHKPTDEQDDDYNGITFEVVEEEANAEGKKVRNKGIYLLPNLFTTAALFSGFYAIIASMQGRFEPAAIAIFCAALFDGMDGRVARMTNTQSAFGEQYDSLSDLVSFGVAPALLVFSWSLQTLGKFGWICAFIYTVCAAFRLARFNVQIGSVDKRYFIGLASPLAAAIIASMVWAGFDNQLANRERELAIGAAMITVFTGFLMVSNFKFYSFKELDRSRVPFAMMLPIVLGMGIINYNLPIGLLAVSVVYALSAPSTALWYKLRPKAASSS
ncbi:CDP-diacylglycerol--serine O-phosphatidyltransferase [Agitococcus lubricus]|uniref:CDP-diacylglycerol--serine O-phosphatidyltransferase n=1 Tax=Agitococcus lubricus TaxID=1077255 RepID=A0A2T5IWF6_9GAMM|nr:CDP-diacylglycerol--serine O-phosphatidyltransferase [Agitococcus lubricus]PTQ88221.1 CDP-diacylglycerol--serine O-phosphatidyltransferase [Agitococcus lubricus]